MRRIAYLFIAIAIVVLAGGFPAYLAFGQGGSHSATVSVTATPQTGGGGGGGGGGEEEEGCPEGQLSTSGSISPTGRVIRPIIVLSLDGWLQLTIDVGTMALKPDGSPLKCIGILIAGSPPNPEGVSLIGTMYDAIPDGATFSPPATLQYTYNPDTLPANVDPQKLVITSYNEISGEWTNLYSLVDTKATTVTADIGRFGDLAIIGYSKEAPPTAAFQISSLRISPAAVETGESVSISTLVANNGGQPGSYQVVLRINGVAEATEEIILNAGASQTVSFTVVKEFAGIYSVEVNGLTGEFEVKSKPVVPPPVNINWWLIGGIVAAVLLAASLVYVFREKIEASGITGNLSTGLGKVTSLFSKIKIKKR